MLVERLKTTRMQPWQIKGYFQPIGLLLLLQELVVDVAVVTSFRHADLSWARRFDVASSLVAGQPPPFLARIICDDQSSVSNHQEDPKCKPVEHGDGLVRGRCGADGQRRTDDDCEQKCKSGCPVRERISSLVTNSDQWTLRIRLRHQVSSGLLLRANHANCITWPIDPSRPWSAS